MQRLFSNMILTTLLTAAVLAPTPFTCVLSGEAVDGSRFDDYNGIRVYYCCPDCTASFRKNPAEALASSSKKSGVFGESLFDPISKTRVSGRGAKASRDYKGIRFQFTSANNAKQFDLDPAKYAALPKKDTLICPWMGRKINGYASALGYTEFNGTRYYACCGGCMEAASKGIDAAVAKQAKGVGVPKIANRTKTEQKGDEKGDGTSRDGGGLLGTESGPK